MSVYDPSQTPKDFISHVERVLGRALAPWEIEVINQVWDTPKELLFMRADNLPANEDGAVTFKVKGD